VFSFILTTHVVPANPWITNKSCVDFFISLIFLVYRMHHVMDITRVLLWIMDCCKAWGFHVDDTAKQGALCIQQIRRWERNEYVLKLGRSCNPLPLHHRVAAQALPLFAVTFPVAVSLVWVYAQEEAQKENLRWYFLNYFYCSRRFLTSDISKFLDSHKFWFRDHQNTGLIVQAV
jgi:hypothetical protein